MRATLLLLSLLVACAPAPAPVVTVVSARPQALDPARDDADDLTIEVRYSDDDGDLGGGVAEISDCRAEGLATRLPIPPIASQAAVDRGVPISGTLSLLVSDVDGSAPRPPVPAACADRGVTLPPAGSAVFCVTLIDHGGHRGDSDCTPAVQIAAASP